MQNGGPGTSHRLSSWLCARIRLVIGRARDAGTAPTSMGSVPLFTPQSLSGQSSANGFVSERGALSCVVFKGWTMSEGLPAASWRRHSWITGAIDHKAQDVPSARLHRRPRGAVSRSTEWRHGRRNQERRRERLHRPVHGSWRRSVPRDPVRRAPRGRPQVAPRVSEKAF